MSQRNTLLIRWSATIAKDTLVYSFVTLVHSQSTEIDMWPHTWQLNIQGVYVSVDCSLRPSLTLLWKLLLPYKAPAYEALVYKLRLYTSPETFPPIWLFKKLRIGLSHWGGYSGLVPWPEAYICFSSFSPAYLTMKTHPMEFFFSVFKLFLAPLIIYIFQKSPAREELSVPFLVNC